MAKTTYSHVHISSKFLGKTIIMEPKIPECLGTYCSGEDTSIPRICVAPTVDQALVAKPLNGNTETLYVYGPIEHPRSFMHNADICKNKLVHDAHITGECWFCSPTKFKFLYKIKVYSKVLYSIDFTPLRIDTMRHNSYRAHFRKWKKI